MTAAAEFSLPVRVYYEDTDAGGVVYHASYIRFFERARTEYLRQAGFSHQQLREKWHVLFAVRSLSVEYERPAFLDDLLHISVAISGGGRVYADFVQTATREIKDGAETAGGEDAGNKQGGDGKMEVISTARVRVVCVSGSPLRASSLPPPLAGKIGVHVG